MSRPLGPFATVALAASLLGQPVPGLTIKVAAGSPNVESGGSITITVELQNTSGASVRIPPARRALGLSIPAQEGNGEPDPLRRIPLEAPLRPDSGESLFTVRVTGPAGHPAPYTRLALSLAKSVFTGNGSAAIRLGPGQRLKEAIVLTRFFDMTAPGIYTIRVSPRWIIGPQVEQASTTIRVTSPY